MKSEHKNQRHILSIDSIFGSWITTHKIDKNLWDRQEKKIDGNQSEKVKWRGWNNVKEPIDCRHLINDRKLAKVKSA